MYAGETTAQKRRRLKKRDKYRGTVCVGCRHNYYNFAKAAGENGDVGVSEDYSCWFLGRVKYNKCTGYSR